MATTEDVLLRYAIARDLDFEMEVIDGPDGDVLLTSVDGTTVRVDASPDGPWCSCDEDAVPGTCTHVLHVASRDHPIAESIADSLTRDLDRRSREITELSHILTARKQEQNAISEAIRLLDPSVAVDDQPD